MKKTSKRRLYQPNGKSGILLDIGCGANKQPRFVGMDRRPLDGVDIVHDLEAFPYPLKNESCLTVMASHVIEHISPKLTIDLFNEIWRVLKIDGQFLIGVPYATSFGMMQDPTHCNFFNEATFEYFNPAHPLYSIYRPKPWVIASMVWQQTGNMEVIMQKQPEPTLTKRSATK